MTGYESLRQAIGATGAWQPRAESLARVLAAGRNPLGLDVQRMFSILPPDRPSGESAFRLAEALPRTPDSTNRAELLLDRVPALHFRALARVASSLAAFGIDAIAGQFVYAQDIAGALSRARRDPERFSFDMLGEGARTPDDAARGLARYAHAVDAVGRDPQGPRRYGVSVKLSSIHERYDASSFALVRGQVLDRALGLCRAAAAAGTDLTIDAEESERLPFQLELFEELAWHPDLMGWRGLGIAVQAYNTEILATIQRILALARERVGRGGGTLNVRLVKGAYWDAEIKRAQELGVDAYPVFTQKSATDLAYVAAARLLLEESEAVFMQFATHNPVTLACVLALAGTQSFECQRLHGMGAALENGLRRVAPAVPMRVYAPVGPRDDLLAYLVRRLLENGASTSFVRQAARAADQRALLAASFDFLSGPEPAPVLPLPMELHMPERRIAIGYDLGRREALAAFAASTARLRGPWTAAPMVGGRREPGTARQVFSPAHPGTSIGEVVDATAAVARAAISRAHAARFAWADTGVEARAAVLDRLADRLEADMENLVALCVLEAGKTLADAIADVREAVDFCRYYAHQARVTMARPLELNGPTGESNRLTLHARGSFACISPWNFPVAIFTGQVAAALVAGNTVVAKPAGQTPLAAFRVAELLLEAGVPPDAFHLLPGDGAIGRALVEDPRVAGVVFTGSNATARAIQISLAARDGPNVPLVPLIAETGGLNAMIVDSTALPEQVVDAVVASAFRSAGQRCSSLRMLYLQDEIAPRVLDLIRGALATLRIGDPADPATDVGPVIDESAQKALSAYVQELRGRRRLIAESPAVPSVGHYVAPVAFEVGSIADLPGERFGPVLHVARFEIANLDRVIDDINATGYGLTMGVHSRIDSRIEYIRRRARVGNLYVNRNMIGAMVGVQPFGGEGLSGTGPKAGGPHYLGRFMTERTVTVNTAAAGGDLKLMTRTG